MFVSSEHLKCRLLKWSLARPMNSPRRGLRDNPDSGPRKNQSVARSGLSQSMYLSLSLYIYIYIYILCITRYLCSYVYLCVFALCNTHSDESERRAESTAPWSSAPEAKSWSEVGFRGNLLSNTTCLTQVFFKRCEWYRHDETRAKQMRPYWTSSVRQVVPPNGCRCLSDTLVCADHALGTIRPLDTFAICYW